MEILNFLKQLGFALAGASALWGWVFTRKSHSQIAAKMLPIFFSGLITGFISWGILFWLEAANVIAHEGISVLTALDVSFGAKFIQAPILLVSLILTMVFMLKMARTTLPGSLTPHLSFDRVQHGLAEGLSKKGAGWFFPAQFFLISAVISLIGWTGKINGEQIFFFAHGFHSILTLGTVLTVDYIFFISRHSLEQKREIYPMFPLMSKVIWLGLGIDFASATLVFDQAFELTTKFYFTQIVIGILIINGAFLSGPITRRLLDGLKKGIAALSRRLNLVAGISGSISVISWLTITFFDQFREIRLAYWQFFVFYLIAIAFVFALRTLVEHKT